MLGMEARMVLLKALPAGLALWPQVFCLFLLLVPGLGLGALDTCTRQASNPSTLPLASCSLSASSSPPASLQLLVVIISDRSGWDLRSCVCQAVASATESSLRLLLWAS